MKDENRLLPLSFLFTGVFPLLGRVQKVHIIAADSVALAETAN